MSACLHQGWFVGLLERTIDGFVCRTRYHVFSRRYEYVSAVSSCIMSHVQGTCLQLMVYGGIVQGSDLHRYEATNEYLLTVGQYARVDK